MDTYNRLRSRRGENSETKVVDFEEVNGIFKSDICKEKIRNMKVEDFELKAINSEDFKWELDSKEVKDYTSEELIKFGLDFAKKFRRMVNFTFGYPLSKEEGIRIVFVFSIAVDKVFPRVSWHIFDTHGFAFSDAISVVDSEIVEYNGFTFYDVDACIERGIVFIQRWAMEVREDWLSHIPSLT